MLMYFPTFPHVSAPRGQWRWVVMEMSGWVLEGQLGESIFTSLTWIAHRMVG